MARLLNHIASPSLLLCVAAAALWAWSYQRLGLVREFDLAGRRHALLVRGGVLRLTDSPQHVLDQERLVEQSQSAYRAYREARNRALRELRERPPAQWVSIDHYMKESIPPDVGGAMDAVNARAAALQQIRPRMWSLPLWAPTAVFAIAPVAWVPLALRRRRTNRRRAAGLCTACAYNLTGNTSAVCPECGTPVAARASKHSSRLAA